MSMHWCGKSVETDTIYSDTSAIDDGYKFAQLLVRKSH